MLLNGILDSIEESTMKSSEMQLVAEQFLVDSLSKDEIAQLVASQEDVDCLVKDNDIVTEKTIVRLDKKAKISRAFMSAVWACARKHNDPKFKKLLTVWRMERALEAYLVKKYRNEAMKLAKASVAKLGSIPNKAGSKASKTKVVAKAIDKAKKQLGGK